MYDQTAKQTAPTLDQQALLQDFVYRFTNLNDEQSSLLSQIEDKLHNIVNKRVPVAETKGIEQAPPNDFISGANAQFNRTSYATTRLSNILSHLNSLV